MWLSHALQIDVTIAGIIDVTISGIIDVTIAGINWYDYCSY